MSYDEDHALETFKSLIAVSMEGLKTLLLVNGGAVVALLAFLGQSTLGPALAPHFWWPIAFFVGGVALCTLAFIGSYFTQFSLYNEHFPNRQYRGPKHMTCLWATLALVLTSVICFACGSLASVNVLAKYVRTSEVPLTTAQSALRSGMQAKSPRTSTSSTQGKEATKGVGFE